MLTGFTLVAVFAFVALSVDSGRIVLTETRMQNAVDAAALAASQEINAAVFAAGQGSGSVDLGPDSEAVAAARVMAAQVASATAYLLNRNPMSYSVIAGMMQLPTPGPFNGAQSLTTYSK